jgi:hypothetical protein
MSDSVTGFDRAPARYSAHGRETIDRIRDVLGDTGFVATEDMAKANWYRQMADHVAYGTLDPRAGREGFEPYARLS